MGRSSGRIFRSSLKASPSRFSPSEVALSVPVELYLLRILCGEVLRTASSVDPRPNHTAWPVYPDYPLAVMADFSPSTQTGNFASAVRASCVQECNFKIEARHQTQSAPRGLCVDAELKDFARARTPERTAEML